MICWSVPVPKNIGLVYVIVSLFFQQATFGDGAFYAMKAGLHKY